MIFQREVKMIKKIIIVKLIVSFILFISSSTIYAQDDYFVDKQDKEKSIVKIDNKRPDGRFEFSKAHFYNVKNSPRKTYNFNIGWRFYKGDVDVEGVYSIDFNDSTWKVVNTPHPIEYLPEEASGGVNYQGVVWYRKTFTPPPYLENRKVFLHFEAIMGRSKIYVNGSLMKEYFGGYMPIIVDLTGKLKRGKNVIAVMADNSDNDSYPPGKSQSSLDFVYSGGIYRDVFLIATEKTYITDPNYVDYVAGGGVFVHFGKVNKKQAEVFVKTHVQNDGTKNNKKHRIKTEFFNQKNKLIIKKTTSFTLQEGKQNHVEQKFVINKPILWHPDYPNLHDLVISVYNPKGKLVDKVRMKIGLRSLKITIDGFFLNEEYFSEKLSGANRHQEYAHIGNALPNSLHYKDVKKLRDAGMRIIRSAHYVQDPAFMDACDSLGMFFISTTPGWQFFNKTNDNFSKRYIQNNRWMVRRDRNRPSVLLWEASLNETHAVYEVEKQAYQAADEEYPYDGFYTSGDDSKAVKEHATVLYRGSKKMTNVVFFQREWGDNVDSWHTQNSTSRISMRIGEWPQLIQAFHYTDTENPDNPIAKASYWGSLYKYFRRPKNFIGQALWHSFDHPRGYHPVNFTGGIADAYRRPKISYYAFQAARNPFVKLGNGIDSGPMVYVANYMTPVSPTDVVVFANCDEVRLSVFDEKTYTQKKSSIDPKPFIFKKAFKFHEHKKLGRAKKFEQLFIRAEGYINGKLVATHKRFASLRSDQIRLFLDRQDIPFVANGSDIIRVDAYLTDKQGRPVRLSDACIYFEIEGEGEIIGIGDKLQAEINPQKVSMGVASVLIRSTLKPGKITVRAFPNYAGRVGYKGTTAVFNSVPSKEQFVYSIKPTITKMKLRKNTNFPLDPNSKELENVAKQQEDFEIGLKEVSK